MAEAEHDWVEIKLISRTFIACKKCGVLQRKDGKNRACRGVVKIGLRETSNA